ncbi:MAG: DUF3240 family protein [Pseudomonadales bacterium]|jgi:hypothetical protein|nr:DUF3240 family protein [Pseudomonadales bacterium]
MHTLLILNVAPELEEELVDCLLELPTVNGFSTHQVYGHGVNGRMTMAEQVSGRRKRLQVELIVEAQAVKPILAAVREIGASGLYWEHPVHNFGRLKPVPQELG